MKRIFWVIHRALRHTGIALIAVAALGAGILLTSGAPTKWDEPPKVLQEDDPGWDCRTMGNRICGLKWYDPSEIDAWRGEPG